MQFSDFALSQPLLRAVDGEGYTTPTPIQEQAIPHVLAGLDLLGCAQTGTGKTAAFALPILELLCKESIPRGKRKPRVLVLSPTRELASQIGASFATYGKHTHVAGAVVFGGVNINRQIQAIARGIDVLVATPGRLLDLMGQGAVSLNEISIYVLDEADRMLDMGFVQDVKRITAAVPKRRQTLLFSATMPDSIRSLARALLNSPMEVAVTPVASTAETVAQRVYFVEKADKRRLLASLLESPDSGRALVFTRTKHGANRVAEHLDRSGIATSAIHGNKSQSARERALSQFKDGRLRVLVATDIAARGIDIDGLELVINFDLPNVPECYVHRIGRTGRAGAAGQALSFCDAEERPYLKGIERLIRQQIPVASDTPMPAPQSVPPDRAATPQVQSSRGPSRNAQGRTHRHGPPRYAHR